MLTWSVVTEFDIEYKETVRECKKKKNSNGICPFQCFSLRICVSGKYLFQQPERGKTVATLHPQVQPIMRLNMNSQLTRTEHMHTAQNTDIYTASHTNHVKTPDQH